ncbi:MAG: thioredoxin [Dehalococcoidia bacterium]
MPSSQAVLDVTDANFATHVLESSRSRAVVVDFWAPWCGPCRVLGPVIEKVAAEYGDDVSLAKLNTDENPRTATQYRIQGIPAVKAFRDGKVVAEFTGAVPEPQVRAFFAKLAPSPAEKAAKEAERLAMSGDSVAAEQQFRAVLAQSPGNADAIVGLAQILVARGDREEASALVERAPADRRAKVLKHRLFLDDFAGRHGAEDLRGEAMQAPSDPRARYRLGVMLAAGAQYEAALDELLESVRIDRAFADGAARKAALAVFDILGPESPITREYQRRLSGLLF